MPQWNCPIPGNVSCIAAVGSIQSFDFELVGLSQLYHSVQLWTMSGGNMQQLTIGSINPAGASPFSKGRYFQIPPNLFTGMSKVSLTVLRGPPASIYPPWFGTEPPDTFPVSMACGPGVFTRGCPCPAAGGPDLCSLTLGCDRMPVFEVNVCAGQGYINPLLGFNPSLLQTGSGIVVAYGNTKPCVRQTACADCLGDTRCSLCGTKCIDKGDTCIGRIATNCSAPSSSPPSPPPSPPPSSSSPPPPRPTETLPPPPFSPVADTVLPPTNEPTNEPVSDNTPAAAPNPTTASGIDPTVAIAAGAGGGALLLVLVAIAVTVCVLRKRRARASAGEASGGSEISMSRYSSAPDARPYASSSSSSSTYSKPEAPANQRYVYASHY